MRRWSRSMPLFRRSWRTFNMRSATSKVDTRRPDMMHLEFVITLLRMRMRGFGLGVIPARYFDTSVLAIE
jgi:hypothetical protein